MEPNDPIQPHAGEAPLSLEFGLIVLGIGALIFAYLVWKMWREYRDRQARREAESNEESS